MSKEHKRRPPVFTSAEENSDIKTPEPEIIKAEEDIEALLSTPEPAETPLRPHHIDAKEEHYETGSRLDLSGLEGVLKNGWRVITLEQHTGKTYYVSADLESEGTQAFWRKTRVLSHNKWVLHGRWSDQLTRAEVLPQPIYYKEI